MSDIPNLYRTSIKALILDDEKRILLVREENGLWEMPGGGIDFGEKPHDCIRRELKEEAGLETTHIAPRPSYFVTALNINRQWKSAVFYETVVKDLNFTPTDEYMEMKFFTKDGALKLKLHPIISEFLKEYDPSNHELKTNSA